MANTINSRINTFPNLKNKTLKAWGIYSKTPSNNTLSPFITNGTALVSHAMALKKDLVNQIMKLKPNAGKKENYEKKNTKDLINIYRIKKIEHKFKQLKSSNQKLIIEKAGYPISKYPSVGGGRMSFKLNGFNFITFNKAMKNVLQANGKNTEKVQQPGLNNNKQIIIKKYNELTNTNLQKQIRTKAVALPGITTNTVNFKNKSFNFTEFNKAMKNVLQANGKNNNANGTTINNLTAIMNAETKISKVERKKNIATKMINNLKSNKQKANAKHIKETLNKRKAQLNINRNRLYELGGTLSSNNIDIPTLTNNTIEAAENNLNQRITAAITIKLEKEQISNSAREKLTKQLAAQHKKIQQKYDGLVNTNLKQKIRTKAIADNILGINANNVKFNTNEFNFAKFNNAMTNAIREHEKSANAKHIKETLNKRKAQLKKNLKMLNSLGGAPINANKDINILTNKTITAAETKLNQRIQNAMEAKLRQGIVSGNEKKNLTEQLAAAEKSKVNARGFQNKLKKELANTKYNNLNKTKLKKRINNVSTIGGFNNVMAKIKRAPGKKTNREAAKTAKIEAIKKTYGKLNNNGNGKSNINKKFNFNNLKNKDNTYLNGLLTVVKTQRRTEKKAIKEKNAQNLANARRNLEAAQQAVANGEGTLEEVKIAKAQVEQEMSNAVKAATEAAEILKLEYQELKKSGEATKAQLKAAENEALAAKNEALAAKNEAEKTRNEATTKLKNFNQNRINRIKAIKKLTHKKNAKKVALYTFGYLTGNKNTTNNTSIFEKKLNKMTQSQVNNVYYSLTYRVPLQEKLNNLGNAVNNKKKIKYKARINTISTKKAYEDMYKTLNTFTNRKTNKNLSKAELEEARVAREAKTVNNQNRRFRIKQRFDQLSPTGKMAVKKTMGSNNHSHIGFPTNITKFELWGNAITEQIKVNAATRGGGSRDQKGQLQRHRLNNNPS